MAQKLEQTTLTFKHGHTNDQVMVSFSRMANNLFFTPQQAEDFVKAIQASILSLAEHTKAATGKAN